MAKVTAKVHSLSCSGKLPQRAVVVNTFRLAKPHTFAWSALPRFYKGHAFPEKDGVHDTDYHQLLRYGILPILCEYSQASP